MAKNADYPNEYASSSDVTEASSPNVADAKVQNLKEMMKEAPKMKSREQVKKDESKLKKILSRVVYGIFMLSTFYGLVSSGYARFTCVTFVLQIFRHYR